MRAVMEHANRCRSICGIQPFSQPGADLHSSLGDRDSNRFPQPYPIPPLARTLVPSRRSAPHESCKFVLADGRGYEQTDYGVRLDSVPFGLPCGEVRNGSTLEQDPVIAKRTHPYHRDPPATNSIRLNEEGGTASCSIGKMHSPPQFPPPAFAIVARRYRRRS